MIQILSAAGIVKLHRKEFEKTYLDQNKLILNSENTLFCVC